MQVPCETLGCWIVGMGGWIGIQLDPMTYGIGNPFRISYRHKGDN